MTSMLPQTKAAPPSTTDESEMTGLDESWSRSEREIELELLKHRKAGFAHAMPSVIQRERNDKTLSHKTTCDGGQWVGL